MFSYDLLYRPTFLAGVGFLLLSSNANLAQSQTEVVKLRVATQRAIVPLERAMVGYRKSRRCFSCHHHAHAIVALSEMDQRGLDVDRELLLFQFARTVNRTKSVDQRYLKNQNIGGGVDTTAHALLAMRTGGYQPDETTTAMVSWLLNRNQDDGFWTGTKSRAPTQTSDITRTWLCLNALEYFGTPDQADQIEQRQAKSREWLQKVVTTLTEDKISRIRALAVLGNADDEISKFADELVQEQQDDGGWAQMDELESDAYATGSVLMTLHQYANRPTTDKVYMRGIAYLISTQEDDGTWHVTTRATPVQEYFESGFPHGRDQFISFTATCWAATAMSLALPKKSEHAARLARPLIELDDEHRQEFHARFEKEIWPMLADNGESSCVRCHNERHRSSLRLTGSSKADFVTLLEHGFFHPKDPGGILFAINSKDKEIMMPPSKLPRLKEEQIGLLKQFAQDIYCMKQATK